MDVVSSSIGFFTTAFAAYRKIASAIEIGSERLIWDVLMRIERTRFEIWGRTLGMLDEETGEPRSGEINDVQAIADLDRILQVETVGLLVQDIFKSIIKVLDDFEKSSKKYRLKPPETQTDGAESGSDSGLKRLGRRSKRWNKVVESTKDFTMHLVLAVNDEDMVKDLLKSLADLNDGLEKVLSLSQKTQAANALSSVLAAYETTEELDLFLTSSNTTSAEYHSEKAQALITGLSQHSALLATARVKHRCVEMTTAYPNYIDRENRQKPAQKAKVNTEVQDFEVHNDCLDISKVPRRETWELLWPNDIVTFTAESGEKFQVLTEWRAPKAITPGFDIPEKELTLRRNLLVRLLHETHHMAAATDYRVLDCLGWCRHTGRAEGEPFPLIGFMSKIPHWADSERLPISLHQLLGEAFQSDDPKMTPSLRARFKLAKQLGSALYQLQCSQWLHRNLSSHQVVFFYEKGVDRIRFDSPFLIGLQYSRPDDQSPIDKDARFNSEGFDKDSMSWGSLGLYLHPDFSGTKPRRYRRSDDVYSLGVLLLEIAFWEPVQVFRQGTESMHKVADKIIAAAKVELAAEVGEFYQAAVVRCLEGLRGDVRKQWLEPSSEELIEEEKYDGQYRGEDPEYGLERDLLWKVLREIDKCKA